MSAVDEAIARQLKQRWFTSAGNRPSLAVPSTATTLAVVFPRTEVNALYGVAATPSWLTTIAVTAKTTAGCTLSFGTAAPANATVDLCTYRTE